MTSGRWNSCSEGSISQVCSRSTFPPTPTHHPPTSENCEVFRCHSHLIKFHLYAGLFIMFSVITNSYNTVVFDIDSSIAKVPVGFFGLCRKLVRTRSKSSSAVNGWPLDFCLHRHSASVNCLHHARMVFSVEGVICILCTKCTLHINHRLIRVILQHTKRLLPPGAAIFSLHTLASPSGRNVKYYEKQLTGGKKIELFLLSVQVS